MKRARGRKKAYLRYGIVAVSVVAALAIGFLLLTRWEQGWDRFPEMNLEEPVISVNGQEYQRRENVETFLLLGLDKFDQAQTVDSYNNDKQADFLMLFVFDKDAQRCAAIHINRDTMAAMNILGVAGQPVGTVTKQIALAHTYGNGREVSCRNAADAVSELLLGVRVDHYLSLTMDAVSIYNDLLGGVEVTVLDDFSGVDDTLAKGETVTLMGQQALRYVRSRRGLEDASNVARMERQRQYLNALSEKTRQRMAADENFAVSASVALADYIVSDRSVTQLQEIFRKFAEYDFAGIQAPAGEYQQGEQFLEFYPDEDAVWKIVLELFYQPKA